MKTTSEIALRALMAGLRVQLPGYPMPIRLAKPGDELEYPSVRGEAIEYTLVYCMEDGRNLGCELDLAHFVAAAEKMDEEQRLGLVASLCLTPEKPRAACA